MVFLIGVDGVSYWCRWCFLLVKMADWLWLSNHPRCMMDVGNNLSYDCDSDCKSNECHSDDDFMITCR